MRETFEFRLFEDAAEGALPRSFGDRLSSTTRVVKVRGGSPDFEVLKAADLSVRARGGLLVASWTVRRRYSDGELARAEAIRVQIRPTFEPPGELCGTQYDESQVCQYCGSGRRQISILQIDPPSVPRRAQIANTIAREIVVSTAWANSAEKNRLSGIELMPVAVCGVPNAIVDAWRQLSVLGPRVDVRPETVWGHTPFDLDPDGTYRCPLGHVGGLNVISEVVLDRSTWPNLDIVFTKQLEGRRAGLLRPSPLMIVSPRALPILQEGSRRDLSFEVAHLR